MNIDLFALWAEMGLPVKIVVVVLTIQAVASLTVAVDRLILLLRSSAASRAFAAKAGPLMDAGDFGQLHLEASKAQGAHLATLVFAGTKAYLDRVRAGDDSVRAADLARRAIERKGESVSDDLNRGLGVLASTGSTAPFVGLLGTVLGIINAFQMIAASGSGGIGTIGAAIGEALIVTGYGLCVAIPTVLLFNWITARITRFEMSLTNAGSELADRMEVSPVPELDDEPPAERERVTSKESASQELAAVAQA